MLKKRIYHKVRELKNNNQLLYNKQLGFAYILFYQNIFKRGGVSKNGCL